MSNSPTEQTDNCHIAVPYRTHLNSSDGHVVRLQNRGWYYVALIVGAVVVGGGAFGVVGLLQSHGVISVSQSVAAAIGQVGATPHFWSLWTLAVGGVVVGGGTIFISAYKLCKMNDEPVAGIMNDEPVAGIILTRRR